MIFRNATMDEIEVLSEIRKKQLIDEGFTPDKDIDQELHTFFKKHFEDGSLVQWVAEDGEKIVATGAVVFYELPPSYTNKCGIKAYVTNMYTAPEYRGRGIATKMLDYVVEEAKRRGVEKIFLNASTLGRPVYLKYGFKEAPEWLELNDVK